MLIHHLGRAWPELFGKFGRLTQLSWVGVDLFFALSGFLITANLLAATPGVPSLGRFYKNRAFRIWPLYFFILAGVILSAHVRHEYFPWLLHVFMLQNFMPEFQRFPGSWSLCVEEHFYLVWPLLIFYLPRRWLPYLITAVVVLEPCVRLWALNSGGFSSKLLYTGTPFHLDAIALGSLIALVKQSGVVSPTILVRMGWCVLPPASIAAFWGLSTSGEFGQPSALNYTYVGMMSVAVVCIGLGKNAVLTFAPLRFMGNISYGLYLFHPILIDAVRARHGNSLVLAAVAVAASVVTAAISWYLVERPLIAFGKSLGSEHAARTVESARAA